MGAVAAVFVCALLGALLGFVAARLAKAWVGRRPDPDQEQDRGF